MQQLIRDIYAARKTANRPVISFEFFPPKTDEGDRNLVEKTLPALKEANPDFCSVTYGAGGTTREKTLMIVDCIQQAGVTALAHLTCVNHTRDEVGALLKKISALDCKNILALRGDPPGGSEFVPTSGGFEFSSQLVQFIREQNGGACSIGVAGFPEGHVACKDGKHVDWKRLQQKIDAGADFVLTQLFFDNSDFLEFRDHLTKLGVNIPIVPGIISILSAAQIKRFTALCGSRIPQPLADKLEELGTNDAATADFGIEYATKQCEDLLREGVPGLHFYTLNKAHASVSIVKNLGLAK